MNTSINKGFRKLSSDIPLNSKQRSPNYIAKSEKSPPMIEQIDNTSRYVKKNLSKTVKPRGTEYR